MKTKRTDIFISYRRQGGREVARNLNDRLTLKGYSVFFDYESIRDGVFNIQIFDAIRQVDDFIFVLSDGSLDRCKYEEDWVRIELEYAIKHNKHILLVCPDESFSGFPQDLPETLKPITFLQIHFLSQRYYDESIRELLDSLHGQSGVRRWLFPVLGGVVCLGLVLTFLFFRPGSSERDSDTVKAQCYLSKYRDLSVYEGISYASREFEAFHYEDTLDGQNYSVFPYSNYYQFRPYYCISPIHEGNPQTPPPIFSLRLINEGHKTIVINDAVVEVRHVVPDRSTPVYLRSTDSGYEIYGVEQDSCRIDFEWVDGQTGKILQKGSETIISQKHPLVFRFDRVSLGLDMMVGHLIVGDRVIPFIVPATEEPLEITPNDLSLPTVLISSAKENQKLSFSSFPDRNLVGGETDDRFRFAVLADRSCSFEMRVQLKTVDKKEINTDWIRVYVFFNPSDGSER